MPNFNIPAFQPATDDLFVYSPQAGTAPAGATTMAQIQTFMRNNSDVLKCLVQRLWQPQVQYAANQVVWSPNMGPNLWAKVKTAGTTLGTEPVWSEIVGAEVTDGTVVYTMCEIVPNIVVQSVNGVAADGAGNVNVDTFAETDIAVNADLNNFIDDGFYVALTNNIFSTVQNKPENGAFYLQVVRGKLTTQRYQILFNISTNTIWTRTNITGSNWGVWVKLAKETEVALPVGTILPFAGGSIPSGFLACNGAGVSATTYARLYAVIGNTYGGNSTTFNLPLIEDNRFLEFSSTAGTANSAGLPNLTGEFDLPKRFNAGEDNSLDAGYIFNSNNNAFALSTQTNNAQYTQYGITVVGTTRFTLNAANSNAIYGGSTTVQPKSLTVRAIIKY